MAQPKNPPLSIRLPPETLLALKDEAARRKTTVNALVVRAVQKEIGQWSDEENPLTTTLLPPIRVPPTWPSGALVQPEHTRDPGLTLDAVHYGPATSKPGSRLKKR